MSDTLNFFWILFEKVWEPAHNCAKFHLPEAEIARVQASMDVYFLGRSDIQRAACLWVAPRLNVTTPNLIIG